MDSHQAESLLNCHFTSKVSLSHKKYISRQLPLQIFDIKRSFSIDNPPDHY